MTNRCHNCSFELAENVGFCPMCGVGQHPAAPADPLPVENPDEMMSRMFGQEDSDPAPAPSQLSDTESVKNESKVEDILEAQSSFESSDENSPLDAHFDAAKNDAIEESTAETDSDASVSETDSIDDAPESLVDGATDLSDESLDASEPAALEDKAFEGVPLDVPEESDDADASSETPATVSTGDFDNQVTPSNDLIGSSDVGQTAASLGSGGTDGKRAGLKPLSEGTLLNSRYQIVKKIGGGGMGAVYLACDQNLGGIERAVKEMVQSSIEEEQQIKAVDDFKRESTILSTLDHPAIPTIYDYFFDDDEGRFYLVMKYISGGDLAGRLRSTPGGRIDERTVTEWAIQVADVLAYLHNLPTTIVYRDLKPSNIMLDGTTGKIMLIDFGIARSINSQEKGVTAVGTMGYAPPELFSGQVEPRSDIYSLGSTMFHLLTGADPQNNPLLIFDFQKNPRPRQLNPQLSDQMERILMRSVEYNAESRFPSADMMRRALAEHLDNLRLGQITYGVSEAPSPASLANQFVFCGFCGQQIVATDLFCAFCGAKQPIAQQGVHAEIYPRTGVTAKLLVDGTSELDAPVFSLEKNENLLGRRDPQSNIFPEVDLSKFDPQTKISRRHARIWREGGGFMVEDLGSSNGTVLLAGMSDSVRLLPRQPHPLASGDRIRLGDTTLHFLMG